MGFRLSGLVPFAKRRAVQVLRLMRIKPPPQSKEGSLQRDLTDRSHLSPVLRAIEWVRGNECPTGGIYNHPGYGKGYPEVTGYLIPTLLNYGEEALAKRLVNWLLRMQADDGSFPGPSGVPHIFDTGQVLRGLLAMCENVEGAPDAAKRAGRFLYASMKDCGKGGFAGDPVWLKSYGKDIPTSSHLYVLPAIRQAAEFLGEPKYLAAIGNCLEYYLNDRNALQLGTLTHFLAYELEALIDLGRREKVLPVLKTLSDLQHYEGGVRAKDGVRWVCTPGLAQLAVCWYKVGEREPADKAMKWLESHQMASGGFLGSYGAKATYFPNAELPWAAKFYLDANLLRDQQQSGN